MYGEPVYNHRHYNSLITYSNIIYTQPVPTHIHDFVPPQIKAEYLQKTHAYPHDHNSCFYPLPTITVKPPEWTPQMYHTHPNPFNPSPKQ